MYKSVGFVRYVFPYNHGLPFHLAMVDIFGPMALLPSQGKKLPLVIQDMLDKYICLMCYDAVYYRYGSWRYVCVTDASFSKRYEIIIESSIY
jgi:hypothetical protein